MSLLLALVLAQPDSGLLQRKVEVAVRIQTDLRRGSGVVVQVTPLTVLTCFHVVQNETRISIDFPARGVSIPVTAVAAFPGSDIAFLRAAASGYQAQQPLVGAGLAGMVVDVLGYGKRRGKRLGISSLKVNAARTQIGSLAKLFGYDVSAGFWVLDLDAIQEKGFVSGDSGGPIFGPEDVFLGIAAGRFDRSDDEEHSNFALIPPAVPPNRVFLPVSEGTRGELPYDGAPVHYATSTEVAGTVEVTSPSPAGSRCGETATAALEPLGPPPTKLSGVSPACQTAWVGLLAVEQELRSEHADATALAEFALRADRIVGYALRTYPKEMERWNNAIESLWPQDIVWKNAAGQDPCSGSSRRGGNAFCVEERGEMRSAYLAMDLVKSRKVAATMVRKGELFYDNDKLLEAAFRLPSPAVLRPRALSEAITAEVRAFAIQKRSASLKALELALGKKGTTDPVEARRWVIANALDTQITPVTRTLVESAAAERKQLAVRLAEEKKALLRRIYELP